MKIFIIVAILIVLWADNSFAYLDPGTGSYVLQIVIAGIVSALFTIKMFWRKVVGFLSNLLNGKKRNE
jgi:hypothetical protein